ncbi:MAG TPA: hypothetical protein VH165_34420 [Kofleriaceae bacterium]|nr:hypothetical protein [Kofleriaceae bacterium]
MVMVALTKLAEFAERVSTTLARPFRGDADVDTSRFPRRLQADGWSCGSRSTQAIAIHFGHDVSHEDVKAGVGTTYAGTAVTPIVRYLRKVGLRAGYHRRMNYRKPSRPFAALELLGHKRGHIRFRGVGLLG